MFRILLQLAAALAATAGMALSLAGSEPSDAEFAKIGKRQFVRCVSCHSTRTGGLQLQGPSLKGIVGRQVASVEGYPYSDSLRALSFTWDEAHLDRLLARPDDILPGLCKPFLGLPKEEDRKALIAYLASL